MRIILLPQYKSMLDPALMFFCSKELSLPLGFSFISEKDIY